MTTPDERCLDEMLEAIECTKGYVARGHSTYLSDYDTRELIIHHLEHLFESADQASQRLKKAHPPRPLEGSERASHEAHSPVPAT